MRKLIALFILILFLPGALAETASVTLYVGQGIRVNGADIELTDVSSTGGAALNVNGREYVLHFGDNITVNGVSVFLGGVYPSEGKAHLIIESKRLFLSQRQGGVELYTPFPSRTTRPHGTVVFTITIKNTGEDGFFPISITVPLLWKTELTAGGSLVNGVYLRHGESAELTLKVTAGAAEGSFPVVVTAGEESLRLTIDVRGKAVSAYVPYPEKEAEAGQTVRFQLHVSGGPVVVPLDSSTPKGWSVKFMASGQPVRSVRVSGEEVIDVFVSSPSYARVGRYGIPISIGNTTEEIYVDITKTHAGENGTLLVTVADESTGSYVAGATVLLVRGGRTVTRCRTLSDGTAELEAPEGEYTLSVSKEAYKNVTRTVKLTAGGKLRVRINLVKLPYYFDVSVPEPSKSEVLGNTFLYAVTLHNLGSEADTYSLHLVAPPNWGGMVVKDPSSRTGISSLYLQAGETRTLYLLLIPPDNAGLGNYSAVLTVASKGSGARKSVKVVAALTGSYDISLGLDRYSAHVQAGKTATLTARVYNTGTSPLTDVSLKVSAPSGWDVKVEPERVSILKKGGEELFTVRITVPPSTDAGDYVVNLRATSDQKSEGAGVRITVEKGGSQAYVGIGLILGAVLLLAVLLRKYGRR